MRATPRIPAEALVTGYEALFDPLTRAAHLACLLKARECRDDGWPTVADALDFARVFSVPAAELAAFFGYLGRVESRGVVWVNALRGASGSWEARQLMTRSQAPAFGFQCACAELARRAVH